MFPVIRLPAFSCLCLYCVILSRLLSIPKAKPGWVVAVSCIQRLSYLPLVRGGEGLPLLLTHRPSRETMAGWANSCRRMLHTVIRYLTTNSPAIP